MADALQIAIAHHRAGRLVEAEAIYRQLLPRSPGDPHLQQLLGTLLVQRGNLPEAIALLRSSSSIAPGAAHTWFALAQAQRLSRNFPDAGAAARRSLAIRPEFPNAHNELGLALVNQGKTDEAIASWRRAIELKPDYAEALSNLGAAYAQREQFADAIELLQRALRLTPNNAAAHNNLAGALGELDRCDEAIIHWRRALELRPDFFDALTNLGKTLQQRGDYAEAMQVIQRGLTVKPDDPQARFLRGLLLLVHGELGQGFIDYEHRFNNPHFNLAARTFPQPRWDGSDAAGKTILLHAEQGLGDTMQFVRYAPLLAERGANVVIESPPALAELLRTVPKVQQVISRGEPLPAFDVQASVVSLPLLFGTTLQTIPAEVPYLGPTDDRKTQWRERLGPRNRKRVGLVWSGNPKHSNDARRSIAPRELAVPLSRIDGVTFYSLQKGPPSEQVKDIGGFVLIDHTDQLNDFADTAALVSQLDLVITVDTSVAHLAGAMGMPVWVLLAYVPDWRWMLERSDSPWYPSAKLLRQSSPGDWAGVVERVAAELRG